VTTINRARRGVALALVAIAAGGLIAACGSASSTSTSAKAASASGTSTGASTSGSPTARRAALMTCLKNHGVTLPAPGTFRRPPTGSTTGTSSAPGPGAGAFFDNPKLRAALQACGGSLGRFGGRRYLGRVSHTAVDNYASCLRQHGVPVPAPNFSGKGATFPASVRSNPKFPAANTTCAHLLVPSRPAGAAGTSSSA